MHSSIVFALLLCLFGVSISLSAQQVIYLDNPSFEGVARHSTPPPGWENVGFEKQSPPDTHPSGDFGVEKKAKHGHTYLGLVVRENETYESVAQKLPSPLEESKCYRMEVAVARSETYISPTSSKPDEFTNYDTPCMLRFWGEVEGGEMELLAVIGPVKNYDWEYYLVDLIPSKTCHYIHIEAFYVTPVLYPYNGNILVDDLSPIVPCESLEEGLMPRDFETKEP